MSAEVSEVRAEPDVMKLGQVARRLQVCEETVRAEIRRGRLKAVRIGNRLRVTESQLQTYLEGEPDEEADGPKAAKR